MSVYDETMSVRHATVSVRHGTMSVQDGTMSVRDGTMSVYDATVSVRDGTMSVRHATMSVRHATVSVRDLFYFKEAIMAHREDIVPGPDAAFDVWTTNLCDLTILRTSGTPPAWTHIPLLRIGRLTTTQKTWHDAYLVTLKAPTYLETEAQNLARAEMEPEARSFINEFIRNSSLVSPEDKAAVGVYPRQPPHHVETPPTWPVLEPRDKGPRQVEVPYHDVGSEHRGKPRNVHAVKIFYAILDHEPKSVAELIHEVTDTRSPAHIIFGEEDRGKRVYMAGCWEIEREGETGPMGEIVSGFIP
jgi:hypothetical protein